MSAGGGRILGCDEGVVVRIVTSEQLIAGEVLKELMSGCSS
jgi:hypothetical protein